MHHWVSIEIIYKVYKTLLKICKLQVNSCRGWYVKNQILNTFKSQYAHHQKSHCCFFYTYFEKATGLFPRASFNDPQPHCRHPAFPVPSTDSLPFLIQYSTEHAVATQPQHSPAQRLHTHFNSCWQITRQSKIEQISLWRRALKVAKCYEEVGPD